MQRRLLLAAPLGLASAARASTFPISLYYGPQWDKPFLYPLRTVSGKVLSRGYPIEKVEGEQTDHAWHRGIFYGHGIINGHDFWRELGREKTSRLVVEGMPPMKRRKKGFGIEAVMSMLPPAGPSIGTIRQDYSIHDLGALRHVDATITISADRGTALTFGDTDDGGFAFRLSDAFRQDRGARLRNSSGLETTEKIWGQPARWVDYSAVIGGTPCGVAVFDHPSNLRHPTGWHARGYSLASANPFATKAFSKGKGPDGSYTLAAGGKLTLRYRVVIHEGPFEPDAIEAAYRAWK